MTVSKFLAAAALWLTPMTLQAAQWQVEPDRSSVAFEYQRGSTPETGAFHAFSGEGQMDPAKPEAATLTVRIDTKSIALVDPLATGFATSAEWFDSRNHRYVTYRLTGLTPRPDGRFDAVGELEVRGRTRPVTSIIALGFDGAGATASGVLTLTRSDYRLGLGPGALILDIGPEVAVRFDLHAREVR